MPSAMRKQNSEAASHETAWTLEVSNSTNENIIVSGDISARQVASLGVDASADLSPVEASSTADSACCRAAQSCVATINGRDFKPDDTIADIEMAEMLTAADDAHATEHSKNTNSMDSDQFCDNVGDRNYRPPSIFPSSPHMPRGEPSGCGDATNGRRDELAQQDDGCPPERRRSQRPSGKDSTAIDMSGIDEPSRNDEHLAAHQNAKDAVPIVTGADEAITSQEDSSVHYGAGMASHAPKAKHLSKQWGMLSPDGKTISDLIQFYPSKPDIELLANAADTRAKEKQRESDKFQRKLEKRAAKRKTGLPKSESIPGYVGDKDIDFCLSYVTGTKVNPSCESVNRVNDGGRLKNKKKKKGKTSTSSTPEECSSSVSHPTATTAPEETGLHRPATGNTAGAGASVLAASALSFNEGSVAGSSKPAAGASQYGIAAAPRDNPFQVVDRKKKVKNPVSSTASQPVRMPLRVLPARDVLPPVITFGSCTSNAASTCTDDDRSEGDGASTPTSCTNQPLGSSEMDAGDGCTSLGSPPHPQQQPTTTHGPSVPAKAALPKATWAAVAAAARNRVCDSPATIACHATGTDDQSCGPQKMVTGDDSTDDRGAGSPPRGCAAAVKVATVACETAGYQPSAARLPDAFVQSGSIVSWPNADVNPGILADSPQKKSTPRERGPDSYCERVRPVGEEEARVGESCAMTNSSKIAPVVASTSRSTPAGGRKMDVSSASPEVSLQRSKGVEFVGNQWRDFFLRDAPRRIAFGFHDPLSSTGGRSTAESGNTGRLLQVSSIRSVAGRPSDDTRALDGGDLVRAACLAPPVPVSVPAEEGAAAAAACMPANVCDNRSQGNDLLANAESRRLPASFTLDTSGSSTNVNTPECSSDYSASYLATVAYLSASWQAVQESLLTDASRVKVYGDSLNHEKSGSVAETGNGRRV